MSSTDTPLEQPLMGKDHQLLPPIPIQNTPRFALPTIALGLIAAFIWWNAASGFWTASLPISTTVAACAVASFLMFTVLHEAAHGSVSSIPWVNSLIGRFAMLLVAGYGSFSMYRYAHESHHWHTNESDGFDPDFWVLDGPSWQRPIRMVTVDLGYLLFYIRNYAHRPRNEVGETFFILLTSVMLIIWLADAGHLWTLAVCYLIPQRIALLALAWWFDWLPHNGLTGTAKTDRFQATRNRIGMDWVFTPLMLGQNYHLAHHINPAVPFYRLSSVWAQHAADYQVWNPATSTWNGRRVDCGYEPSADTEEQVANIGSLDRSTFYPLTVQKVYRLTADSATVTFDVPADLAEKFAFRQGQHITIKCDLGGEGVRRNYSICSSTVSGELRIAVKHIPGGAFSTHVLEKVKAGDVFDVMPPSGRFFTPLDAAKAKTYVGIAGGSGITPIFSILSSTLEVEQESRFILLYANKDVDSIMFRDELRELRQAYPNRFQLLHFLSREPQIANYLQGSIERESYSTELPDSLIRGHLDRYKLAGLMNSYVSVKHVDDWFLCGPEGLVDELSNTLEYHGVDEENIHKELFVSGTGRKPGSQSKQQRSDDAVSASISVACQGEITEFDMEQAGEFVLDAAMRDRDDLPYACQSGACGTCRARVTEGSVEMEVNMALENDELEAGYVLTCQARPTSSRVALDFDQ